MPDLDHILADHATRAAADPVAYEKTEHAWVIEANGAHDPDELKALVVALEQEVAKLRAGVVGPALRADLEDVAKTAEAVLHRDFEGRGDRHYLEGVHDGIAWALGWNDPPDLPEPLPKCAVCRDEPPVGRRCPGCREWS
jgi:hypothetical protein